MNGTDENQQQTVFSKEQRKFLRVVFKRSRAKLGDGLKKYYHFAEESPSVARKISYSLLKRTVLEEIADFVQSKGSLTEKLLSLGSCVQLVDVAQDMQKQGLIEAMMQKAAFEVAKIQTNPHHEVHKFIEEVFLILDKLVEAKKEQPETLSC